MITASSVDATRYANEDSGAVKFKLEGLSTNQKPTVFSGKDVKNGSTFFEIDTGVTYVFDEDGKRWYPQPQAGGSGVPGAPGKDGKDGADAYEVAVQEGFVGTRAEWLESLKGGTDPTDIDWSTPSPEDDIPSDVSDIEW